jgi:hypothetical protein
LDRNDLRERIIDSRRPRDHNRTDPKRRATSPSNSAPGTRVRLGSASRRKVWTGPCGVVDPGVPFEAVVTGVVFRICGPGGLAWRTMTPGDPEPEPEPEPETERPLEEFAPLAEVFSAPPEDEGVEVELPPPPPPEVPLPPEDPGTPVWTSAVRSVWAC